MAQKQLEERVETMEKEILGLKEIVLDLKKVVERIAEDMKESNMSQQREESCTLNSSGLKVKGKMEEMDTSTRV